jgi:hypothetical protein
MKNIFRLKLAAVLVTAGLLLTLATAQVQAQQVTGPVPKSGITNAVNNTNTVWQIRPAAVNGITNVSTAQAVWVPVGRDGFGVAIKSYGTNAALTTNVWFILEFTADGVNAITNNNVTICHLPRGVATNVYYTNFVASTSATFGNISAVRIKSVDQTNGVIGGSLAGTLFVEKFTFLSR